MINETLGDLLRECVFGRGCPDLENRHLDDLGRHSHAVAIPMDQLDGHDNQQRNLKKKKAKGKEKAPHRDLPGRSAGIGTAFPPHGTA
jgi:hypothetical protein